MDELLNALMAECEKLREANKELKAKTKWYRPEQRPNYNPDDPSFSKIVFARWGEDGQDTAEIWFDFENDDWMWEANQTPISYWGIDFKWTYLPELPSEGE